MKTENKLIALVLVVTAFIMAALVLRKISPISFMKKNLLL